MKDLIFFATILLLLGAYWLFSPLIFGKTFKRDIDHLPATLKKGYHVDQPFTTKDLNAISTDQPELGVSEEYDDESTESTVEPEPFMEEPHHTLGAGTVAEVQTSGQVYDAQGKSYYRQGGCDVFVE